MVVKFVDEDSPFLSEQLQGPNLAIAKRADVLSEQIAVEHRKYSQRNEARDSIARRQRLKASRRDLVSKAAFKEAAASLQRAIIARDLAACVCLCRGGGPSSTRRRPVASRPSARASCNRTGTPVRRCRRKASTWITRRERPDCRRSP